MGIEIVHYEMPLDDRGRARHRPLNVPDKIVFGAGGATRNSRHLAGSDFEVDDERQGAMPNVFKLPAFNLAWSEWQARMFAFQSLNPGHFVGAHHPFALFRQFGRLLVQRVDVRDLLIEPLIRFRGQPVTDQVRTETLFLSSRDACRGEIVPTMPRFTSSSAISRPVHWLRGRPDCSGFSQASCSIWQIWSTVKRAGAPGRGKSSSRSSQLKSFSAMGCNAN